MTYTFGEAVIRSFPNQKLKEGITTNGDPFQFFCFRVFLNDSLKVVFFVTRDEDGHYYPALDYQHHDHEGDFSSVVKIPEIFKATRLEQIIEVISSVADETETIIEPNYLDGFVQIMPELVEVV